MFEEIYLGDCSDDGNGYGTGFGCISFTPCNGESPSEDDADLDIAKFDSENFQGCFYNICGVY